MFKITKNYKTICKNKLINALVITPSQGCQKKRIYDNDIPSIIGGDVKSMVFEDFLLIYKEGNMSQNINEVTTNPTQELCLGGKYALVYGTIVVVSFREYCCNLNTSIIELKSLNNKLIIELLKIFDTKVEFLYKTNYKNSNDSDLFDAFVIKETIRNEIDYITLSANYTIDENGIFLYELYDVYGEAIEDN